MKSETRKINCLQAKNIDLVEYLASLGHQPIKIKGPDYWYTSPLRTEKTASFKVNRPRNQWYDFALGVGGSVIDFAIRYHACTIRELLTLLETNVFVHQPLSFPGLAHQPVKTLDITGIIRIRSLALLQYLKDRKIPYSIAVRYCTEVHYNIRGKSYYALGFKNDGGGYELRNPFCKLSTHPKGITTVKNGAEKIAVFEGFFDFLSFITVFENQPGFHWDFCILNSLAFFEKSIPFFETYKEVHLCLDNDAAGQNSSRNAVMRNARYHDESRLYLPYKDVNEWLVTTGKHSPIVIPLISP